MEQAVRVRLHSKAQMRDFLIKATIIEENQVKDRIHAQGTFGRQVTETLA